MNDSEILSAIINAEIALCGKGYPDARVSIICKRGKYTPGRPWTAEFYLGASIEPAFIRNYPDATTAVFGLALAIDMIERRRPWTLAEIEATLGVEVREAAE